VAIVKGAIVRGDIVLDPAKICTLIVKGETISSKAKMSKIFLIF
jgi:hypothetical protein